MAIPSYQLALFIASRVPEFVLRPHAVPTPDRGEVLVKVEAVALNPTDWKSVASGRFRLGNGAGNDFAGRVVALGEGSYSVSMGDRVAGRTRPGFDKRNFAFQEYLATSCDLLIRVPDNVSFDDASTLPVAATTAAIGMKRLVGFPGQVEPGKTLLVCGGTSCVGMFACQFAKISGLRIVATASPRHFDLVRSLGASSVVDYHAADACQQILDAAGPSGVDYAFDSISMSDTVRLANEVLKAKSHGEKKTVTILPIELACLDPAVEYRPVIMNSIYDKPLTLAPEDTPAIQSDYETALALYKIMAVWLAEGKLKPSPVALVSGGLNGIPDGLALLKAGEVSATKLVCRISDTVTPSPA